MNRPLELGQLYITKHAQDELDGMNVLMCLKRYLDGDWGDLCDEDKEMNDNAINAGGDRVFAIYHDPKGKKFYIITEADREVTTILLAEDY